jgi:MFS family permease
MTFAGWGTVRGPTSAGIADESRYLRIFAPALVLLAVCLFINYIDRSNLSLAAPLLKEELHISATQLGVLFSAFFWTYTTLQFVSGWLVDRFGVNRVIAAGFLLWSLATAMTGVVRGFTMLFLMRLMLGIGESVAIPGYSRILARYLPEHNRGFANGILIAAQKFGPAVGTLGAGFLIAKYGWRPVFYWNWSHQPGLAARLDKVDATRRRLGASRYHSPEDRRHSAAAVFLGCLRGAVF